MNRNNVFYRTYLPWKNLTNLGYNFKNTFRSFKWAYQRITRGFCDCDVWNLDTYLCELLYQTLTQLKETSHGYPGELTYEQWQDVLTEMADLFKNCSIFDEKNVAPEDRLFSSHLEGEYLEYDDKSLEAEEKRNKWRQEQREREEQKRKNKDKAFELMSKYFYDLWD